MRQFANKNALIENTAWRARLYKIKNSITLCSPQRPHSPIRRDPHDLGPPTEPKEVYITTSVARDQRTVHTSWIARGEEAPRGERTRRGSWSGTGNRMGERKSRPRQRR